VQPLPDYTRRKPLAGGQWGYYFEPPSWARKPPDNDDRGPCPVGAEQLGKDYAAAVERVENVLLPLFDSWRTRGIADLFPPKALRPGTLDWLFAAYRGSKRYKRLSRKMRLLHETGFGLVGNYLLKDGRKLGEVMLTSIDPDIVDQLYEKLLPMRAGDGRPVPSMRGGRPVIKDGEPVFEERRTSVNHAMKSCRRAWNVGGRLHKAIVPAANPFAKMGLISSDGVVTAAEYEDLLAAVAQADAMGLSSLGTMLMVTWEWLQREEHIATAFELAHYRPKDHPNEVYVVHPKNGEAVWIPLFDKRGDELFPELMERMDAARRDRVGNGLFFVRDWVDRRAGVPLPWATPGANLRHMARKVREVLLGAGIDPAITFTSFRHGGLTELGDNELTDAEMRALSRHKSAKVLTKYVKRTQKQIIHGTRKRRAGRPPSVAPTTQLDLFGGEK